MHLPEIFTWNDILHVPIFQCGPFDESFNLEWIQIRERSRKITREDTCTRDVKDAHLFRKLMYK